MASTTTYLHGFSFSRNFYESFKNIRKRARALFTVTANDVGTYSGFRGRRHGHDPDAQIHPERVHVEKSEKRQQTDQVPALFPERRLPVAVHQKHKTVNIVVDTDAINKCGGKLNEKDKIYDIGGIIPRRAALAVFRWPVHGELIRVRYERHGAPTRPENVFHYHFFGCAAKTPLVSGRRP